MVGTRTLCHRRDLRAILDGLLHQLPRSSWRNLLMHIDWETYLGAIFDGLLHQLLKSSLPNLLTHTNWLGNCLEAILEPLGESI
jgi:hypothetical protein